MPNTVMPRVPLAAMSPSIAAAFHRCVEKTGDGTIIEVMAHQPDIMRWYFEEFYGGIFYNRLPGMRVDVRSKELLRIKLSKQHGCQLCNRSNTLDALAAGITQEMIDAIHTPDAPVWSEKDRAVIALAEEMTLQNMDGHLSADLHARLRAHYDDGQIVELGFVAAILTGIAKWIFTFDIVDREEVCPIRQAGGVRAPTPAAFQNAKPTLGKEARCRVCEPAAGLGDLAHLNEKTPDLAISC